MASVLDLNINYNVPEKEKDADFTNARLTYNYVMYAIKNKYPDGLDGQLRKIWGRIQKKLDEALDSEKEQTVELEAAEVDIIKGAFTDKLKFPVAAAKYVLLLEDAINKL